MDRRLSHLDLHLSRFHVSDVVDLLCNSALKLNQSGSRYAAVCPFHESGPGDYPSKRKSPFSVSVTNNCFYCFNCGTNGGPLLLPARMLGLQRAFVYLENKLPFDSRDDQQRDLVQEYTAREIEMRCPHQSLYSYTHIDANPPIPERDWSHQFRLFEKS